MSLVRKVGGLNAEDKTTVDSLDSIPDNTVPMVLGGNLIASSITDDGVTLKINRKLSANKGIKTTGGSIEFGEETKLGAFGSGLVLTGRDSKQFTFAQSHLTDIGSSPMISPIGLVKTLEDAQMSDIETETGGSFSWYARAYGDFVVDQFSFRGMSNTTGMRLVVRRNGPSGPVSTKSEFDDPWEEGDGFTLLSTGDTIVNLDEAVTFFDGDVLHFTLEVFVGTFSIKGDTVAFGGQPASFVPYFTDREQPFRFQLLPNGGGFTTRISGDVLVSAGSDSVVGTGTLFLSELIVGQAIQIREESFIILSITDDTHLTLSTNHTTGAGVGVGGELPAVVFAENSLLTIKTFGGPTHLSVDRNGDVTLGDLNLKHAIANGSGSSWLWGGKITTNTSTTVDISAGEVLLVDNHTDRENPVYSVVPFGPFINQSLDTLLTSIVTYFSIDADGLLIQQTSRLVGAELRVRVPFAAAAHQSGTLTGVSNALTPLAFNTNLDLYDLATAVGIINTSGNIYTPNGNNLSLDKSSGTSFRIAGNLDLSVQNPNVSTNSASVISSMQHVMQDGSGGFVFTAGQTTIDVGNYDDGTGTLSAVGNNRFSVFRIVYDTLTGQNFALYGQETYPNIDDAISGISHEVFNKSPSLDITSFRSWIVVKGSATDLSNTSQAVFIVADKFGSSSAGAASASGAVTFQAAYNNSLDPEIGLGSDTSSGITIKDNAAPIGNSLLEILNDSGSVSYLDISANGTTVPSLTISDLGAGRVETDSGGLTSAISPTFGTATQADGSIVLGTSFGDVAGVNITLPVAGSYKVWYSSRGQVDAENKFIVYRLYNTTSASVVADTESIVQFISSTGSDSQGTSGSGEYVTVTSPTVITLQGKGNSVTGCIAISNNDGRVKMGFDRM